MFKRLSSYGSVPQQHKVSDAGESTKAVRRIPSIAVSQAEDDTTDEQQPLLRDGDHDRRQDPFDNVKPKFPSSGKDVENQKPFRRKRNQLQQVLDVAEQKAVNFVTVARNPKTWSRKSIWQHGIKEPISLLPCVFLGVLLNVLDALSYGTPANLQMLHASLTALRYDLVPTG